MKSFLKKITLCAITFSVIFTALPKKEAKAGFLILAATDQFVLKHKYETLDNLIPYIGFATMLPFGFWFTYTGYSMQTLYSGLLVLDSELDQAKDMVKASLAHRYPYIDDIGVVENLSKAIWEKYPNEKNQNGDANIKINEHELLVIIEPLDLNSNQINDLVESLTK